MTKLFVISAIGQDRTGVVQDLTECIVECGGNIIESRMSRLGQEFAMLLLISGNWHTHGKLEQALARLEKSAGLTTTMHSTESAQQQSELLPYAIDVVCLNQSGIVLQLARFLAARGIDIAEVNTRSYAAPHTGAPMFSVQMNVGVPAKLSIAQLREDFMELSDQLNLDAIFEPVKS